MCTLNQGPTLVSAPLLVKEISQIEISNYRLRVQRKKNRPVLIFPRGASKRTSDIYEQMRSLRFNGPSIYLYVLR